MLLVPMKREAERHRFSWLNMKWTLSECRKDTAVSENFMAMLSSSKREREKERDVIFSRLCSFLLHSVLNHE